MLCGFFCWQGWRVRGCWAVNSPANASRLAYSQRTERGAAGFLPTSLGVPSHATGHQSTGRRAAFNPADPNRAQLRPGLTPRPLYSFCPPQHLQPSPQPPAGYFFIGLPLALSPPPDPLAAALRAATASRLPALARLAGTELLPAGVAGAMRSSVSKGWQVLKGRVAGSRGGHQPSALHWARSTLQPPGPCAASREQLQGRSRAAIVARRTPAPPLAAMAGCRARPRTLPGPAAPGRLLVIQTRGRIARSRP